ncbi:MAG: hypothetical protein A1D16_08915, partial [Flavihumibacter sp. CACIAM 22H1]
MAFKNLLSLLFTVSVSMTVFGQTGISGATSVTQGNSYTYYPTYNGSSTYAYNGSYSYYITGGVVSGTSNTSASGYCSSVLYSIGLNVTWTSSSGSLYFTFGLGSTTIYITAASSLQPGTITPASQTINYNTSPTTLSGTAASGGGTSPTYLYQWMSSPNNSTWTDISGATSQNYSPGSLTATTYYRRKVTVSGAGTTAYTTSVLVAVHPQLTASISPSTQNLSAGATGTTITSSVSGGNGTYTYQWQTSPNNSTWTNAGTSSSYSPGVVTATRYVRLLATSNGVQVTSNTATISVCTPAPNQITGSSSVAIGSTIQLAGSLPSGTWSSSNTAVATINTAGLVTGKTVGNTTISYSANDGCGTSVSNLVVLVDSVSSILRGLGTDRNTNQIDTIVLTQGNNKETLFTLDTVSYTAHQLRNVIALRIVEESKKFIPGDFAATVVLKVEYGHSLADKATIDSIKLQVNFTKDAGNNYNALHYYTLENAEYIKVTVLRIEAPTTVNGQAFDTKEVLLLTNSIMTSRYFQLADNKKPTITIHTPIVSGIPDDVMVSWLHAPKALNNSTQVEWSWLENEFQSSYVRSGSFDTSLLFKLNATRIEIPGSQRKDSISVPLLYGGNGKLYVRVRAVNITSSGSRNDGPWSGVGVYSFTGHNDTTNWQVTTSFAEDGKRKTVIQYADGSLRYRQTVTKDNSSEKIVVAESLYDTEGRPVVQILPAPLMDTVIRYKKNLNLFVGQGVNTNPAAYFDFTSPTLGRYGTSPMVTTTGAASYYSSSNTDTINKFNKHIPAANGFAYAVTRYTPDGTGRVMRQGGVGDSLAIGGNHATRYYYGSPGQEELHALFGTEVGNATHYFKNMVQDANGQMSVSYVDMQGRTIATALAGDAPVTQQALNISDNVAYPNQAPKTIVRNLLDKNSNLLKETSIESISSVLVPYPTSHKFVYQVDKKTLTLPKCTGGTVSYDIQYNLQISIVNEAGETPAATYTYTGITNYLFNQTLTLQPGSYSVRKTLSINLDSLDKFLQQYNTVGIGICQAKQVIIDSIVAQDSIASGCAVATTLTTAACQTSLGTYSNYLTGYATSIGLANSGQLSAAQLTELRAQYVSDSVFCASLNENRSATLDNIRAQMLEDMVPYSGQYAQETLSGSMANKYNIFSPSGNSGVTQPYYKNPRLVLTGGVDRYYNDLGAVDSSILPARLSSLTKEVFEQEFKPSWTKSLLVYHPEYKKLKYAEDTLRASFNFIDSLQLSVNTAFNLLNTDPFFNGISSTADKNLMRKYSDTSWQGTYSMWQLAYAEALGCKSIADATTRTTCFTNMPKALATTGASINTGAGSVTLTATHQTTAWAWYKSTYSLVRNELVNKYINIRPGGADTADNSFLVDQKYKLHFPYNNVQRAKNNGWDSFYPNNAGVYPAVNLNDSVANYQNKCDDYIDGWKQALLECPSLNALAPATRQAILDTIINRMRVICKTGTDAAHPFGSSTVPPAFSGATYTSFDQVVNTVFQNAGISLSLLCNPYSIEFPKPYANSPLLSKQYTSGLEDCNCTQYNTILDEIINNEGSTSSLTQINNYLRVKYKDTISLVLYQGLQNCYQYSLYNCRQVDTICNVGHGLTQPCTITKCDTLRQRPLPSAQPLPDFLTCGFDYNSYSCLDCNTFKTHATNFYSLFGRNPVFTGNITNDTTIAYNSLFAKYVNFKTGLRHTWQYYAERFAATSCGIGGLSGAGAALSICPDRTPVNDTTGLVKLLTPCEQSKIQATLKADTYYDAIVEQKLADFRKAYWDLALAVTEQFRDTSAVKEYHYTLYYYDQSGNLVKTVPPAGVQPIYRSTWLDSVRVAKINGTQLPAQHRLVTRYSFNSLNQVVVQKTPDAGMSKFWYDRLGRLVISQNAKQQLAGNVYSYTLYDALGRISQVGQITGGTAMTDATAKNATSLQNWINAAANSRNQITQTVYDLPLSLVQNTLRQKNLRNRVSYTQVINLATQTNPASATYYTYDIQGNVDTIVQDFGSSAGIKNAMNNFPANPDNRYKKIAYNYDLISGKVNQVSYQPGKPDAYYHRYEYDAENRLTQVYSGRDSIMLLLFPEREAQYEYYAHGPLARTILGKLNVQGLDHAYTLQGWLKGINPAMGGSLTNGTDTTEAKPVAQDVFGFSLHYFRNDYKAIWYNPQASSVIGGLTTNASPLYNGNIAAMAVNVPKLSTTKLYNYKYDQLNRLVAMDVFNGLNPVAGTFTASISTEYRERVGYDPNGNILTYQRNGDAARLTMDNLTYSYKPSTNQLHKVVDAAADASAGAYPDYQDLRTGQGDNNYVYDAIGNLVQDVKDTITNITWNVYGKIESITQNAKVIRYTYDAAGNRISKSTTTDTTFYVRDATGNVLSVYRKPSGGQISQEEVHLYGSSRLGIATRHLAADSSFSLLNSFGKIYSYKFTRGEKLFELSNHLGNVLVTLADRVQQVKVTSDTVRHYLADIRSANDYYPFGMLMPGRKFNAGGFRYGFNGKENDNEVKGTGNQQDYGMRIYDPRLGRFLSLDPLQKKFPTLAPCHFSGNNPIATIDLDGLEPAPVNKGTDALILILQGYGGDPPDNNTQATNAFSTTGSRAFAPDGILNGGILEGDFNWISIRGQQTQPKLQVVVYASSATSNTKNDVLSTIKNFKSINPDGKVIVVGHSGGGDNLIELAKENRNVIFDLLITLDTQDPKIYGIDDNNVYENVKNAINYYQISEPVGGETLDFKRKVTNGINVLSPGSNHRSIDNDNLNNIKDDIGNFLMGVNAVEAARTRFYQTKDPASSNSQDVFAPNDTKGKTKGLVNPISTR